MESEYISQLDPTVATLGQEFGRDVAAFKEPGRASEFYNQVLAGMERTPQMRSASVINTLPLGGNSNSESFQIPGRTRAEGDLRSAGLLAISPRYLGAMAIPVLAGRAFDTTDSASAPLVAIVNRTLARRMWPDEVTMFEKLAAGGRP